MRLPIYYANKGHKNEQYLNFLCVFSNILQIRLAESEKVW